MTGTIPQRSASVVMPTYARASTMESALRAALADPATLEVVVVVDGSHDGTFARLSFLAATDGRIRPIWQENAGAAAARQTGVEAARGQVVVIIDDDVLLETGTVTGHVRHHAGHPGLVVLGYMPVLLPGGRRRATARFYARAYEAQCERYEAEPAEILSSLWAGNVSMRRADALRVGCANPDLPMTFHADREWGLRLRSAGLSARFDRSLRASHVYRRSVSALRRDAVQAAEDVWSIHRAYRETIGPMPENMWLRGQSTAVRALVGLSRHIGGTSTERSACAVADGLDRVGATGASMRFLAAMRTATQQRITDERRASERRLRRLVEA